MSLFLVRGRVDGSMTENWYYYCKDGVSECNWYVPVGKERWKLLTYLHTEAEANELVAELIIAGADCSCLARDINVVELRPMMGGWKLFSLKTGLPTADQPPGSLYFGAACGAGGGAHSAENAQGVG